VAAPNHNNKLTLYTHERCAEPATTQRDDLATSVFSPSARRCRSPTPPGKSNRRTSARPMATKNVSSRGAYAGSEWENLDEGDISNSNESVWSSSSEDCPPRSPTSTAVADVALLPLNLTGTLACWPILTN